MSLDVPAPYAHSAQKIKSNVGLVNTKIVLTGSWFVALALQLARREMGRLSWLRLLNTLRKSPQEYPDPRPVLTLYYMFTGIHLLHVLIATGFLIYLLHVTQQSELFADDLRVLESGAVFWHLIDILRIALFATLCLLN